MPVCFIKEPGILQSFNNVEALQSALFPLKESGKTVGFVPTMGALHDGHISLLRAAKEQCDIVVVSIFVNPTQFNDPNDLANYPRTEAADVALLEQNGCDFVFIPTVSEVYPENYTPKELDLSPLDEVMEGAKRPGHFIGVVNVVSRLFEIVSPHKAFFGRKDFQQVAVIKEMTRQLELPVEIIAIDTQRAPTGLALSSRNARLSEEQLEKATTIYRTLMRGKELVDKESPQVLKRKLIDYFSESSLELEYLEIVNPITLLPLNQYWVPGATACIVAYCGGVRLIDNMELVPNA